MAEKKQKLQAGGKRREFAVDATKIGDLFQFANYTPINEYEALMQAAPGEEPVEVDAIMLLRNAVLECVEQLTEKDRFCLDAIFSERITYEELGSRLGYTNENSKSTGSSSAFLATKRALGRLEKHLRKHPIIMEYIQGLES
jgi:hypothetical protein